MSRVYQMPEKCKRCVWCDMVNKDHAFCMFPRCINNQEKKEERYSEVHINKQHQKALEKNAKNLKQYRKV